jgi:glutathione S-transferase
MKLRLHYAPDNASLIVRLALEEMGLPYDVALVDRAANAQHGASYLALNPNGLIPVLETPQGAIFETGAILLWLADTQGLMAPRPDSPRRGAFLKWLFFTSNTLHADLRMLFYPVQYVGTDRAAQRALCAALHIRLRRHLEHLETVAASAPDWLAGAEPSVLCYYVACLMRWMALYPKQGDRGWYDVQNTQHLRALLLALQQRPATRAAQTAEGLGPTPFTAPVYADPPEGTAT